ncbi:TonB system transport protein ExbD [Bartonella tamiae]|uniref:Biopolymer transport protein ExbD n=1 Tax=Bartonella tamiae Th239 TaxID=1094558 RepID=J1K2K9_9HYPH|nr:TonB system transport protein ExbD [Bartonella tamiae]EJF91722.1 TonB system transporter ExbD [Bartonella tamiae Th239]EJF92610.1 TonB system transporter ExbD [Bartonella tamiae Th307]
MAAKLADLDNDELDVNHDINVTPFIDVILVLLIIFMVAAPLATSDIPIQLPTAAASSQPRPDKPVYVTLQKDQSLYVGEENVSMDSLKTTLDRLTENNRETKIFIRGDQGVEYGGLMRLLNNLKSSGYLKIGLVGLEQPAAAQ